MAILYNIKAPESTLLYKISTGSAGPRGEQGPAGSAGPKGDPGTSIVGMDSIAVGDDVVVTIHTSDNTSYSYTVPQGKEGPQGPQGEPGPKGDKGEAGSQGPEGKQGPQGEAGPGITDISSKETDTGAEVTLSLSNGKSTTFTLNNGPEGKQGPKGDPGSEGPKGDKGDTGSQGPAGPQGDQGVGVTSITENTSTEDGGVNTITFTLSDGSTQNATVKNGSKGSQGPQGLQGEKGSEGPKGDAGFSPTITQEAYVSPAENWTVKITTPATTETGNIDIELYKNGVLYDQQTYISVYAGPATPELTPDNKGQTVVTGAPFTGSTSFPVNAGNQPPQYLGIFYKDSESTDMIGYANAYPSSEAVTATKDIKQEALTGTKVTITNESSSDNFIVYNGQKGSNGADGTIINYVALNCSIDNTDIANSSLDQSLVVKSSKTTMITADNGGKDVNINLELKANHLFPVEGVDYNAGSGGSAPNDVHFYVEDSYSTVKWPLPLYRHNQGSTKLYLNTNVAIKNTTYDFTSYNNCGMLVTNVESNYDPTKVYYNFSPYNISTEAKSMCNFSIINTTLNCLGAPLFGYNKTKQKPSGQYMAADPNNGGGTFILDIKSTMKGILAEAFMATGFKTININGNITGVNNFDRMFYGCIYLENLTFADKDDGGFKDATSAVDIFKNCSKLANLILPESFGILETLTRFDLSPCIALTHDSIVNGVFNKLATRTNSPTLQLSSTSKALLSEEELAIATNKGWVVS